MGKPPDRFSADDSYEWTGIRRSLFMLAYFWVAIGGALGSVGRYWFSGIVARQFGETFPWGTLFVNVAGSFLIGLLAALAEPIGRRLIGPAGQQLLLYGVCGGFTTFSSFSLQTLNLLRDREWLYAGGNIMVSVALCLVGVWLGYILGAMLNSMKGA